MRMWWLILATCGVMAAQQPAQKPAVVEPPPSGRVEATNQRPIVVDVFRVNLLFTVNDKKGRFITDLVKDDFQIIENKRPQIIQEFTAETDLPLRLAILIDTSNSVRDRFRFEQEAAIEFINSVVRPRQDKAMIVSFDTAADFFFNDTATTEKLAKNVRNLRPGG